MLYKSSLFYQKNNFVLFDSKKTCLSREVNYILLFLFVYIFLHVCIE